MSPDAPTFPSFRKITLADRALFENYFSNIPPDISEYTFTNFYIWRDCDRSMLTSVNDNICVVAYPADEPPYFFEPLGDERIQETIEICLSHVPRFSRVSEEFTKAHFEGKKSYKIEFERSHCDYLYNKEDLINLRGRKYDGKRNKIKKFLKNFIPIYHELAKDNVADCLKLLGKWIKGKTSSLCFDEPIKEALANFPDLDVKGALVRVNGVIEAFTIGEVLNPETAVIYIEVANPEIDGFSQYINQQFCLRGWAQCRYINREQDLGDPGLRRAKLSYHPAKLVNKYSVTLMD